MQREEPAADVRLKPSQIGPKEECWPSDSMAQEAPAAALQSQSVVQSLAEAAMLLPPGTESVSLLGPGSDAAPEPARSPRADSADQGRQALQVCALHAARPP
jgi:hypothetical protein